MHQIQVWQQRHSGALASTLCMADAPQRVYAEQSRSVQRYIAA